MPIPLTNDVGSLQCCASAWLERPPRVSPRHHLSCCASVVVFGCLPLDEQLLGGLGMALQPSQPWLLVHPGYLLASRQPLARDGDDLAVGRRPSAPIPSWAATPGSRAFPIGS
jgi:hypothetical protein